MPSLRLPIKTLLRVAGFMFFLLVIAISFILWQQWQAKREALPEAPQRQELADQKKKEILEKLSAPPGARQYTAEEKRQVLESLSARADYPTLSEKEKKKILDSLSAPNK